MEAGDRESYLHEVEHETARCEPDWGSTLKTEDYKEIGCLVKAAAQRHGGGCFALLEGEYNHDILGYNVMALIEGLSA